MGRVKEANIGERLGRRLDAKAESQTTEPSMTVPASTVAKSPTQEPKKRARDGMHYIGCHVPEEMFERLRTVAFETRKEKQILMREGLEVILKKYGA